MDGIRLLSRHNTPSPARRLVSSFVLAICIFLVVHAYLVEPFQVPTGSMAPALLGHHRSGICPRCGFVVKVGRTQAAGAGGDRCYAGAFCPNCGSMDLRLGAAPETSGDHVLVSKSHFDLRRPRRWEVIVFHLFGKTFIKRLIGLGGEEIELVDGDVYIDGKLARKTFDEFLGMRVLVFDNDFAPAPGGWNERWTFRPENPMPLCPGQPLTLDGRGTPHELTYGHFSLDERKCLPIGNEYAYNGDSFRAAEPVHDFMVETEVEVLDGKGTLSLTLTDGGVEVEVAIGVGEPRELAVRTQPRDSMGQDTLKNAPKMKLLAGNRYHIEMALVDRRLTLRVDGRDAFTPLDLPETTARAAVERPLRLSVNGVSARLHHVRLYRDAHYTQAGKNAVHGRPVRLAIDQTFVLGDNSANSEDSRFWPNHGMVPVNNLVGRAFLVHLPSRTATWQGWGRRWQFQLPDWEHVRWVR